MNAGMEFAHKFARAYEYLKCSLALSGDETQ